MILTVELNGVTADGCDRDAPIGILAASIAGLGLGETRTADQERIGSAGSVAGTDYQQARVITVPVVVNEPDNPDEAWRTFRRIKAAWQPVGADQELLVTSPGIGPADHRLRFYGRPRSTLEPDVSKVVGGIIYARLQFVALDPVGYGPAETTSGSPLTIINAGDTHTTRSVIEIVGTGSTPIVTHEDGGDVSWLGPLGMGQVRRIDLATFQVTDGSGVDKGTEVSSASLWFRLAPGANVVSVAGASSPSATFRSAYL